MINVTSTTGYTLTILKSYCKNTKRSRFYESRCSEKIQSKMCMI